MTTLSSLQCRPLLQSATLIDFVCFGLAPAHRSSPEPYADLPYCPDDRALRRHIHSIPPQYIWGHLPVKLIRPSNSINSMLCINHYSYTCGFITFPVQILNVESHVALLRASYAAANALQ